MSSFLCERLSKAHDRQAFDCGVGELNEYLRHRATQDMRRRAAAVFVLVPSDQPRQIAGFYSLSSASIMLDALPDEIAKKLPRYPSVPAIMIGRLARDIRFRGVGRLVLLDALARTLRHTDEVAAAIVLVDAKSEQAHEFYSHYGFVEIRENSSRLFLPMTTVKTLLTSQA